jgi:hypothetical protein
MNWREKASLRNWQQKSDLFDSNYSEGYDFIQIGSAFFGPGKPPTTIIAITASIIESLRF